MAEGGWRWVYTNRPLQYKNWGPRQPDNLRPGEHCMEIDPNGGFKWFDRECDRRNHFICEYMLGSSYTDAIERPTY